LNGIFFYFSGTGNTYAVSKEIADNLGGLELVKLTEAHNCDVSRYDVIGFGFPVYYLHAPDIVLRTVEQLKLLPSQRVFNVITYGASYGYALSDVREIQKKSGAAVQEFRVKMPGNYILEYGAFPRRMQHSRIVKSKAAALQIAKAVLEERRTKETGPNVIARIFKHSGDNKAVAFRELGRQFYTTEDCNRCMLCATICPMSNIKTQNGSMVWQDKCLQCMACIQWCPQNAILHPSLKKGRKRYTHPDVIKEQLTGVYPQKAKW